MIMNSMRWCKQLGIGNIISVTRNLFCIQVMKPCDILILKRSLTLEKFLKKSRTVAGGLSQWMKTLLILRNYNGPDY